MHPQYGERDEGKVTCTSFRGSVQAEHTKVVWTTAALLPQWAILKSYQYSIHAPDGEDRRHYCNAITAKLVILAEPTVKLVTSHCQNVSFRLEKENDRDLTEDQILT